jgi:hypothetical protein
VPPPAPGPPDMTSKLPPAPPEDDDRERKWIIEGLRQALGRATVDELARLTALLEPEADGAGNVAGWLVMLVADEMGRQHVDGEVSGSDPDAAVAEEGGEAPDPEAAVAEEGGEAPDPEAAVAEEGGEAPQPEAAVAEEGGEAPQPEATVAEEGGEACVAGAGAAEENGQVQPADLSDPGPPAGTSSR